MAEKKANKRILYDETKTKALTNTTAEYLEFKEVDARYVLYVTAACGEEATNAPTTITFGKMKNGAFTVMEEEDSPAAGIGFHTENTHHFRPGEKPCFRFEGGTSGNILTGYIEGYLERI